MQIVPPATPETLKKIVETLFESLEEVSLTITVDIFGGNDAVLSKNLISPTLNTQSDELCFDTSVAKIKNPTKEKLIELVMADDDYKMPRVQLKNAKIYSGGIDIYLDHYSLKIDYREEKMHETVKKIFSEFLYDIEVTIWKQRIPINENNC